MGRFSASEMISLMLFMGKKSPDGSIEVEFISHSLSGVYFCIDIHGSGNSPDNDIT